MASARETIEKTRHIARLEMAWYKNRKFPGVLRKAAFARAEDAVFLRPPWKHDKADIHTHTGLGAVHPSYGDLEDMAGGVKKHPQIRAWHIVGISRAGRVTGYASYRATKELLKEMHFHGKRFAKHAVKKYCLKYENDLYAYLAESGLIRSRFTPMPGWKYSKKHERFVRK